MKKQNKKSQYIAELAFERDHFQTELKRIEEQGIKDFRPVWYLGDNFTKYAAQKRIRDIDLELNRIDSDISYTPWKDNLDPRRNLSQEDIQRIKYHCPNCGKKTDNPTGICEVCETAGVWIDPAGGIHTDDEEDPAAQYE